MSDKDIEAAWRELELELWPHGPAHGSKSGIYASCKSEIDRLYRQATEDAITGERARIEGLQDLLTDITEEVRPAISNAYYDARNAGDTMEDAASRAAGAVLAVLQDSPTLRSLFREPVK